MQRYNSCVSARVQMLQRSWLCRREAHVRWKYRTHIVCDTARRLPCANQQHCSQAGGATTKGQKWQSLSTKRWHFRKWVSTYSEFIIHMHIRPFRDSFFHTNRRFCRQKPETCFFTSAPSCQSIAVSVRSRFTATFLQSRKHSTHTNILTCFDTCMLNRLNILEAKNWYKIAFILTQPDVNQRGNLG